MIVTSAVFVEGDDEEGFGPKLARANVIVDIGDELFPKGHHGRRMHVALWAAEVRVISWLDEAVRRQLAGLAIKLKLAIEMKVVAQRPQFQKRLGLCDVVEVDLPAFIADLFETVIDRNDIRQI